MRTLLFLFVALSWTNSFGLVTRNVVCNIFTKTNKHNLIINQVETRYGEVTRSTLDFDGDELWDYNASKGVLLAAPANSKKRKLNQYKFYLQMDGKKMFKDGGPTELYGDGGIAYVLGQPIGNAYCHISSDFGSGRGWICKGPHASACHHDY